MKQNLSLVIALMALTVAAVGWLRPRTSTPHSPALEGPVPVAPVPVAAPVASPSVPEAPVRIVAAQDPAVAQALRDLQLQLLGVEARLEEMKGGWDGLARRGMVPLTEEYRAALRAMVLGTAEPWNERIEAFRLLRRHNEVTDDIAMAMVQLAQTGSDERSRDQALRNLDGITNAIIQPALIAALGDSGDATKRQRAADALSAFSGDPSVDQWLRQLAANDESPQVRREARQALHEKFQRMDQDALQAAVLDDSLPPDEQVAALRRLRDDSRSSEVVTSMMDLYASSEDANLRAEILRGMDGVTDRSVLVPWLSALAQDPNPAARGEIAENLRHMREDPDVRAWLEWAAANDESEIVQRAAQAALEGREPRGRDRGRGR